MQAVVSLHEAARANDTDLVAELLAAGHEIDCRTKEGQQTPLHYAARRGHCTVVQMLARAGANLTATEINGWSALMFAARRGHCAVCGELIPFLCPAAINQLNHNGLTALSMACMAGHEEVVSLLLENGAVDVGDNSGWTALHACCKTTRLISLARLLVQSNGGHPRADIPAEAESGISAYIDSATKDGDTALHLCSRRGHTRMVAILLAAGARCDVANKNYQTALHFACCAKFLHTHECHSGRLNQNCAMQSSTSTLRLPLCAADNCDNMEVILKLLAASADSNAADCDGFTPLHAVCSSSSSGIDAAEAVDALVSAGASADLRSRRSLETPLHTACRDCGHTAVIEALLIGGASIRASNALVSGCSTLVHTPTIDSHILQGVTPRQLALVSRQPQIAAVFERFAGRSATVAARQRCDFVLCYWNCTDSSLWL
eukprot:SAG31_NODE_4613_length_3097_cov_1.783189_1_plen_434_part_00